jgi:lipopolysaccharide/colanic/teichoic acid biosynthesis glycosyltransferase
VAAALPALLLTLPLIGVLMLMVRLDSPGGALFTQEWIGRAGRRFTIYKLRTFHSHCHGIFPDEEIHWKDPRVTRLGSFLRKRRLDELPQLLNVLLGHMSFVGPRPDLPIQARTYGEFESRRLLVRPGLTGIAQISGNTTLSWSQRIRLDCWYIEHRSIVLDLAILLYTVPVIARGERHTDDPFGVRTLLSIDSR